jgi:nucleoporin NDC1
MVPPVARRAPYKDFLQPALQRRFAGTAAIVLALAYLEALTLSNWDSCVSIYNAQSFFLLPAR